MLTTALIAILSAVLLRLVVFYRRKRTRTNSLSNVSGPPKEHWLKGNYHRLFQDGFDYNLNLASEYGGVLKIYALLGEEQLYVSDPKALQNIVVKEQQIYEETEMFILGNKLILGEGLVSTLGEQHRRQRKILNPVFSIANIRELLPLMHPIASKLRDVLACQLLHRSAEIDIWPWVSRSALEYVSQGCFGYSFNALEPKETGDYALAIRDFALALTRIVLLRPILPFIMRRFSISWRMAMVRWLPIPALKEVVKIVNIMDTTHRRIFAQKIAAIRRDPGDKWDDDVHDEGDMSSRMRGRDVMSVMLRANLSSEKVDQLSDAELLGQMGTILLAGFEGTSVVLCNIIHILASRPEIQAKLRTEIQKANMEYLATSGETVSWEDVNLPHNALMSLPFLDAVTRETLRVYPPTSLMTRTARQDTVLPLQYPIRAVDGTLTTSVPIEANTTVIISILAANHNKNIWGEDASTWKPERWLTASGKRIRMSQDALDEEDAEQTEDVPGTVDGVKFPGVYASMMTFMGGGRSCIGFKFVELEIKQVLATLLPKIHFALPSTTDAAGRRKEIYWKMNGFRVSVVRPPFGDDQTAQLPLELRLVRPEDFA